MQIDSTDISATNFWKHVVKHESCWAWDGCKTNCGYGRIGVTKQGVHRVLTAHRASWMLTHGDIPPGMEVCHTCDNPECVNPDHLFIASHKENMHDAVRKGRMRQMKGPFNKRSVLTMIQVNTIRETYIPHHKTYGRKALALRFNVGKSTIDAVVENRRYNMTELLEAIARLKAAAEEAEKRAIAKLIIQLILDLIGPGFTPLMTEAEVDATDSDDLDSWADAVALAISAS